MQRQRLSQHASARRPSLGAVETHHAGSIGEDEDERARPRVWDAPRVPTDALRQYGSMSSQRGAHGLVVRPVVRLVGLDKARARDVLLGLVPSGRSHDALGLPHGLLTALRRLGVPDVFASAMRAEVESYGSAEVLIDDYLEFVTSFGSATGGTAAAATDRGDARAQSGECETKFLHHTVLFAQPSCLASCVAYARL